MHIKTLKLQNFRNYENVRFVLDPAVNLICGENGQGKTNLLEAAAACSTMRLFRTAQKKEGLRFGEDAAFICSEFEAQGRENTLELRLSRLRAMEIYKNGVRQKRQSDVQGLLKTVLFCPEDLMLVRAGAAARRRFLDTALCQLRPNYARYLEEYNRLHEHKTRILRDSEEKPSLLSMWEDFSLRMARIGAQIIRYRAYYCRRLLAAAAAVYSDIAPHEALSGVYRTVSSVSDPFASAQQLERELIDHVFRHKNAEIAAKSCLSGPHKDDLELLLDGRSASAFASQGQVRTCTLSLKLAERELFFEEDGEYPVLLLDDVLSEPRPPQAGLRSQPDLCRSGHDHLLRGRHFGKITRRCGISYQKRQNCISLRYTNARKCGIIK